MYIHYDRQTEKLTAFTSLKAVSIETGIKYDTLNYQFGRLKRTVYKKPGFILEKTNPISSKRAN